MDRVLFSSKSDEWRTPKSFYGYLNSIFHFDLDPCSSDSNHLCSNYFTIQNDGLSQSWAGHIVFCNPPYSNLKAWVKKAYYEHFQNGSTVVLFIPARTDTSWFHEFINGYCDIYFLQGRFRFSDSLNPAPFPSMVCVFHDFCNIDFCHLHFQKGRDYR